MHPNNSERKGIGQSIPVVSCFKIKCCCGEKDAICRDIEVLRGRGQGKLKKKMTMSERQCLFSPKAYLFSHCKPVTEQIVLVNRILLVFLEWPPKIAILRLNSFLARSCQDLPNALRCCPGKEAIGSCNRMTIKGIQFERDLASIKSPLVTGTLWLLLFSYIHTWLCLHLLTWLHLWFLCASWLWFVYFGPHEA